MEEVFENLPAEYSHLYLAIDNELAAAILIEDPLREESADIVERLKSVGISKVVMMTGDCERTAKRSQSMSVSMNIIQRYCRRIRLHL